MRPVVYHVAISVDGFLAEADGSFGRFLQEGDHVADYLESWRDYDTVIMGRRTYDVGVKFGVTNPYPTMRTYVCSRSLEASPDPAVTLLRDGVEEVVRGLRDGEGKRVYLCGGGDLAAQLVQAGLVDELVLKVNPIALGRGVPLFGGAIEPQDLTLRDARTYPNGVVTLSYRLRAS